MVRSGNRANINTRPRQLQLPKAGVSSDVQAALMRLQTKLQAIPAGEREERERRFQDLDRAMRRGRN